ncbi:MAG: SAM-dependent methyltransferase [Syntrophales bacterium]|nr:SAM-dependent methyltransferase [Syntrophales bacterium]
MNTGTLYGIGIGPGDPELITLKGARLLGACRICIYAGSLVSPGVLALIPDQAERHDTRSPDGSGRRSGGGPSSRLGGDQGGRGGAACRRGDARRSDPIYRRGRDTGLFA